MDGSSVTFTTGVQSGGRILYMDAVGTILCRPYVAVSVDAIVGDGG